MATKYTRAHPAKWPGVYFYESIERRFDDGPDVCYVVAFKVDDKKRWEKVGWKSEGYTPQVAAELRAERVKAARHGQDVKTNKELRRERAAKERPLDDLATAYFEHRVAERWGKFDEGRYRKHVAPILGQRPVSKLSPLDVTRLKAAMKGYKPATVWGALEIMRRILNFGCKNGLCAPLAFVIEMPRKDNEVVEYLEPQDAASLLEVLAEWPAQDVARMLKLAMFSGMRRGEIFKLEVRDLDFRQGLITLRAPKGGKTVSIPMNPIARAILEEQLAWAAEAFSDSPYVFPGRGGGLRTDSSAVDRIKAAALLPKSFRIFHGLRHHFAVTLANSGEFTLDMIGELLTHKSTAMTRRYGQFLPDAKKRASDKAAELLASHAGLDAKPARGKKVVKIGGGE